MADDYKLDNPVWYSLCETHSQFAINYNNIKFYHPDYCPFGGFIELENTSGSIEQYSTLTDNFFIVGEKPSLPSGLVIKNELVCLQMLMTGKTATSVKDKIAKLTQQHHETLYQLVNLVQPGYFKTKTALLGDYFGIFENNQLIAVTGERMKMDGFTEVSAVITHPDYTGKGYAKQLVGHSVNRILNQNKMAYLHVAETNTGAIALYEKLGFITRRKISFWNVRRKTTNGY